MCFHLLICGGKIAIRACKGFGPWTIKAVSERRFIKPSDTYYKPFCVGEYWDGEVPIDAWLDLANSFNDNPVSAFDFPLRYERYAGGASLNLWADQNLYIMQRAGCQNQPGLILF